MLLCGNLGVLLYQNSAEIQAFLQGGVKFWLPFVRIADYTEDAEDADFFAFDVL